MRTGTTEGYWEANKSKTTGYSSFTGWKTRKGAIVGAGPEKAIVERTAHAVFAFFWNLIEKEELKLSLPTS